jgi:hypothetical protein
MKGGGAVFKFSKGRAGASSANVRYITREKAASERVWTRNIPEHAQEGETHKEQINNLREYARQREEDEISAARSGSGESRTHYRAIYSFDREISDEQAQRMIDAHLDKNLPNARCVAAIHRDTDHTHAHVWIDARDTDERKIQLNNKTYKTLDDEWAKTYAKEFDERSIYDEHIQKKYETQNWKREAYEARQRGEDLPEKPARTADQRDQIEERRAMYARQYGATEYDENGITRNQRRASSGEQEINRSIETSKRAEHAVSSTTREVENEAARLRQAAREMAERSQREIDREAER